MSCHYSFFSFTICVPVDPAALSDAGIERLMTMMKTELSKLKDVMKVMNSRIQLVESKFSTALDAFDDDTKKHIKSLRQDARRLSCLVEEQNVLQLQNLQQRKKNMQTMQRAQMMNQARVRSRHNSISSQDHVLRNWTPSSHVNQAAAVHQPGIVSYQSNPPMMRSPPSQFVMQPQPPTWLPSASRSNAPMPSSTPAPFAIIPQPQKQGQAPHQAQLPKSNNASRHA